MGAQRIHVDVHGACSLVLLDEVEDGDERLLGDEDVAPAAIHGSAGRDVRSEREILVAALRVGVRQLPCRGAGCCAAGVGPTT